jgi:hypothetical protein
VIPPEADLAQALDERTRGRALLGASDLQASPLSEGNRRLWVMYIRRRAAPQDSRRRQCPPRKAGPDHRLQPKRSPEPSYYAARNNDYTVPRAAPFAGKALALAQDPRQGLSPPHGPYREGRTAAPPRTLPRTVRSGRDCRLIYAPHSKIHPLFLKQHTPKGGVYRESP